MGKTRDKGIALLAALTVAYVWLVPLAWPRGVYLWGHYRLVDLYLGLATLPFVVAAGLAPFAARRPARVRLMRLSAVLLGTVAAVLLYDGGTVLSDQRFWRDRWDYWLDVQGNGRTHNLADPELGYVRKPNLRWHGRPNPDLPPRSYRTDRNGFRNPSELTHAPLVVIGDSFTEGAQVEEEETFVQQAARLSGLSAANLGRGGYGPPQELKVLQRYAAAYRARYVVWQLYDGNDLGDAQRYSDWLKRGNAAAAPWSFRYYAASPIVALLERTRPGQPYRLPAPPELRLADGGRIESPVFERYRPDGPQEQSVGWAATRAALAAGARWCAERKLPLLVLVVPTNTQVLAPYARFRSPFDREHYLPGGVADGAHDFAHEVEAVCEEAGVECLRLYPRLREAALQEPRGLYCPADTHFGSRGHALVGTVVADWLRRHSGA